MTPRVRSYKGTAERCATRGKSRASAKCTRGRAASNSDVSGSKTVASSSPGHQRTDTSPTQSTSRLNLTRGVGDDSTHGRRRATCNDKASNCSRSRNVSSIGADNSQLTANDTTKRWSPTPTLRPNGTPHNCNNMMAHKSNSRRSNPFSHISL